MTDPRESPKIYVAGAYTARTLHGCRGNVIAAQDAGLDVAKAGGTPLIPHTMFHGLDGALPESWFLAAGLAWLRTCDAVYVFDRRHLTSSRGTRGEVDEARRLRLPVFTDVKRLRDWIAKVRETGGPCPW